MEKTDKIPWACPTIGQEELEEVQGSFDANWLTMGPKVNAFESVMADYVGVPHAVALTNGSVALDIALKMLGVGPGDEIIIPAMTYYATAAAVSYQHAVPVFVDIDPKTNNIDPGKVAQAISPKTRGIIYIDYGGNPADHKALNEIAASRDLFLLQDAAQSLGGIYKGDPMGAQTEISTMSFHMAKVMTTVEGGMIFTHNNAFAQEARIRRNQGESGKYLHSHLGTNARMTDLAAGIGLAQFKKMPTMLKERERVAGRYDSLFRDIAEIEFTRRPGGDSKNAYFFYPIQVDCRDELVAYMADNMVDTRIAYPMPLYQQEIYRSGEHPCRITPCPVTEKFTAQVVNLPIFPGMTDSHIDRVAGLVVNFVDRGQL